MTDLNEMYKEMKLSPLDNLGLARIEEELARLGIPAVRTEQGTVRAELKCFGQNYLVAFFVSGREVFYTDEHVQAGKLRSGHHPLVAALHEKQELWLEKEDRTYHPLERRIFIVDFEGFAARPENTHLVQTIELDLQVGQKVFCTLDSLREAVTSPFRPVAHRANEKPFAHHTRASRYDFDKPTPDYDALVTKHYEPNAFPAMCEQWAKRGNRAAVLKVASKVFSRILGSTYHLVDVDDCPEVARVGSSESLPAYGISRGEQAVLSYSLFLALQHDRVREGMCIGIKESLNGLDELRHMKALTCLAEFVMATGASVYYQTDKTEPLRLAEKYLKDAVKIAAHGSSVIPL